MIPIKTPLLAAGCSLLQLAWVLQMNEQEYIAKEKLLVELEYHIIE